MLWVLSMEHTFEHSHLKRMLAAIEIVKAVYPKMCLPVALSTCNFATFSVGGKAVLQTAPYSTKPEPETSKYQMVSITLQMPVSGLAMPCLYLIEVFATTFESGQRLV